ncbi:MAG: hypothetical protein AAB448_01190 [Patescibacteria group bacterium]
MGRKKVFEGGFSRLSQEKNPENHEKNSEVVSFEEGVKRMVDWVSFLLEKKDLVTFSMYGVPHSGKSYFASIVMEQLRKNASFHSLRGGDVKGYDELPNRKENDSEKWVMFIQHPFFPAEREVNNTIIKADLQTTGMPQPDGSFILCDSAIPVERINIFCSRVDMVIKNPLARKK